MKVMFATPTYKGITYPGFLNSVESTVTACAEAGHEASFVLIQGCCYVQEARNQIVQKFMESDADQLFFLDDDISWPASAAIQLVESSDDVVAGIYPLKSEPLQFPAVINTDANHYPIVRGDGCISANGLPTGFMRITRTAIDRLIAAYPGQRYENYTDGVKTGAAYDLFPQGVHGGRWVGEDYAFCRLWREIGGEMWVYPDIDFTHGGKAGNYHRFLMDQPRG